MGKAGRYIAYFLDLVLILFIIVLCGAFFSLTDERITSLNIPSLVKVIGEFIYYLLVLFLFFTERKIELNIWLRSILMFVFLRVIISFGNALVFQFISTGTPISFPQAYSDAFLGYLPVYAIQVLTTPFLAYPLIMEYIRSRLLREEEVMPAEVPESPSPFVLKPDSPTELSSQVISARKWRNLLEMKDEQEASELISGMAFAPSVRKLFENVMHMENISKFLEDIVAPVKPRPVEVTEELAPPPVAPPPIPKQKAPQAPAEELGELEKLLQEAEQTSKPAPVETPIPILEPEISTPLHIETKETEIPVVIEPQTLIPELTEEKKYKVEGSAKISAEPHIPEPIVEQPAGHAVKKTIPSEPQIIPTQKPKIEPEPIQKTAPAPPPQPPQQIPPPTGGYAITSAEGCFKISVRKLIELNKGKQSAQVLERLIRRGADFELSVPMTFLIPQLKEGKAEISVEQIYNEIPLELVNFMSSDASGDLSSQMIELPIKEIMQMTDPVVIFGVSPSGQKESPWAKATEQLGVDKIFGDEIPESATQDTPIIEDERKILDLTKGTPVQAEPPVEKETAPQSERFDKKFLELAHHLGVFPQYEKCEKIGVVTLAPLGVSAGMAKIIADKIATQKFSPQWENTPAYMLVWTPHALIGFRLAPGFTTKRDCLILISSYRPIHEFYDMLEMSATSMGKTTGSLDVQLSDIQPIPLPEERSAQYDNYRGYWTKIPGLSLILLSSTVGDEDLFAQLTAAGKEIASIISGAGGIFTGWQRTILWCNGWAMTVLVMPGGYIIASLPPDMSLPQLSQEVEQLAQKILGGAK